MQKKDIEKAISSGVAMAFAPRSGTVIQVTIIGEGKTKGTWSRPSEPGWVVEPVNSQDRWGIDYLENRDRKIVVLSRQIIGEWTQYQAAEKARQDALRDQAVKNQNIRQAKEEDGRVIRQILDLAGVEYGKYEFDARYVNKIDNPRLLDMLRKVVEATENRRISSTYIDNIDRQARS